MEKKSLQYSSENKRKHNGPGILALSRSTAYIANLPFSFTNCDLIKVFEKYGKIVKVTVMKDKQTRKSKGVAFILFGSPESASSCVSAVNGREMFGRTLRANIAKDNGRAPEFIRRREYPDKSRCYECREKGHLSYACPKNILGEREPPLKKKKFKDKKKTVNEKKGEEEENEDSSENEFEDDSLSAAIRYQQELREGEEFLQSHMTSNGGPKSSNPSSGHGKLKQSSYFSDEDEMSD